MEKRQKRTCKNKGCGKTVNGSRYECGACRQRRWVVNKPVTSRFVYWKRNTKARGIPNDVTLYQYTVFGIESGYFYFLSLGIDVTIDRPDSTKGYTFAARDENRWGNLQLLTRSENASKAHKEISYLLAQRGAKQPGDVF